MSLIVASEPAWSHMAAAETLRWPASLPDLVAVRRIGSTAIPGLPAKPVIDLLSSVTDGLARHGPRGAVEALGYEWMDEFGLDGRACERLDHAETGRRRMQAHGACKPGWIDKADACALERLT